MTSAAEPRSDKSKANDGMVSLLQAARIARLHATTLATWIKTGLIEPTNAANIAPGTGNHRRFDLKDLTAICVCAALREGGVDVRALRKVQTALRNHDRDFATARLALIVPPKVQKGGTNHYAVADVALLHRKDDFADLAMSLLKKPGQFLLADIELAPVVRRARQQFAKVSKERPAVRGRRKGVKYGPRTKRAATG